MICGHLFAGINGFGLASDQMGWETAFNCEIDKFCQIILKYYWPNAEFYGDIKTTDFTIWENRIDLITGGFPCQPFSTAGKRKGTTDDRSLWPEMYRAVREIQPAWVVAENVPGLLNWGKGLVFEQVQTDLEAEGYEVQPLIIPAAGLNAPHKRDRIWFIAYSEQYRNNNKSGRISEKSKKERMEQQYKVHEFEQSDNVRELFTNTDSKGSQSRFQGKFKSIQSQARTFKRCKHTRIFTEKIWEKFPTQSPVCSRNDGLSSKLSGITFSKHRRESIKAYGNSIVPQIAYELFKTINEVENYYEKT